MVQIEKENCECNRSNTLIENPNGNIPTLLEIGLLPNKTGQRIDFNPTAIPSAIPSKAPGGGLSTGAKAGIGVGVAIAGLLLIAGAVFMFLRRRRRANELPPYSEEAEMDGAGGRHEKGGSEVSELRSSTLHRGASVNTAGQQSELSSDTAVMELPSSEEEKLRQFSEPSPQHEPMELDVTNGYGYYGAVNGLPARSEHGSDVSAPTADGEPARDVSPDEHDRPTFMSPFNNNETVSAPQDSQVDKPRKQQLKGSRAYSVASPAADPERANPRVANPGSIPTAGGIEISERSRASRREKRNRKRNSRPSDLDIEEA